MFSPLSVMLSLGSYRFGLNTAAYQTLERSAEWRWPQQDVIGRFPVRQWVGPGNRTIKLQGLVLPSWKGMLGLPNLISRVPELAGIIGQITTIQSLLQRGNINLLALGEGKWQLDALRVDAEAGVPLLMIDGRGRNWGYWVIDSLQERESRHFADGAYMRLEFDVSLSYYGDEPVDSSISPQSGLLNILRGILGV
ncbi:MAG: phage tail protein [Sphingobacteriia bacterium]|nr:phage tail protein [Sphingobacteriia bacterium]